MISCGFLAGGRSAPRGAKYVKRSQTLFLRQNVFSNINRILSDAAKLIESNHYASGHVRGVAARLDKTWKDFAGCLDERTTVLALSVQFHQRAEMVRQF